MNQSLTHRKALLSDVPTIIKLLSEDELGQGRESIGDDLNHNYVKAFTQIDADPNHYLMLVQKDKEIIGTCHLTVMPSLSFTGATRMQIDAVRVAEKYRGQGIGAWMMSAALDYGRSKGVVIVQLTTNKKRLLAKKFYESLGFEASHEGMKLRLT